MTQQPAFTPPEPPDISHIVTEDDEPVDNWYSEKVQRLLTTTLYASWAGPGQGRPFIAAAHVGIFFGVQEPPIVPDVFVSCDVALPEDIWEKRHRTYFVWEFGKTPELVVEIVSNRKGGEDLRKKAIYADIGIAYYAVYDPTLALRKGALRVYELRAGRYVARRDRRLPTLGLGFTLWRGTYEGYDATWLRWTDGAGELLPSAAERAESADRRAESADRRAESADQRAESADQRAARLATRLRELGVDPDEI